MPVRERTDLEVEGPEVASRGALALADLNQSNGRWWSDDSRHDRWSASAVSLDGCRVCRTSASCGCVTSKLLSVCLAASAFSFDSYTTKAQLGTDSTAATVSVSGLLER